MVFPGRFDELRELSSTRHSQLEDSLGLQQFFYDMEMEMAWIREHMTVATSEDLGTSLIGVQRLQKRHQVMSQGLLVNFFITLMKTICHIDIYFRDYKQSEKPTAEIFAAEYSSIPENFL